jgi:predicted secreted protein
MVNANQIVYGGTAMIFISTGTTNANLQPAAFSTAAKLTVNLGTREISSKDSADWSEFSGTKFDWDMSTDTLMNLSGVTGSTLSTKEIYAKFVAKQTVYVSFASATGTAPSWTKNTDAVNFTGQAIITNMSFDAPNYESATASIALKGTGVLAIAG